MLDLYRPLSPIVELRDVRVLAEGLTFPEGPVAMDDGSVVLVEIFSGRITRVGTDGSKSVIAEVPGGPNGAAMGPDGRLYVCNNGGMTAATRTSSCIQRVDLSSGQVEVLYDSCEGRPFSGLNDLVFDRSGNFWFTDFTGGRIFYAKADGSGVERKISRLSHPNGIGLSPDENTLYWAHTQSRQVLRCSLDGPGSPVKSPGYDNSALVRNGSIDRDAVLLSLPGMAELDSLAVDSAGNVCVGTLVDGGVTVVSPDGATVERYRMPPHAQDGAVTNICFGGPDLSTAYLTLSMTGRLVSCRWPRPGLRLNFQR